MSSKLKCKLKKCSKCKIEKDLSKFHKCKSNKDGLQYRCKECTKEYDKIQHLKYSKRRKILCENNTDKIRNQTYIRNYNITIDDYNILFEKQNGKCAVCGKKNVGRINNKFLIVDHNHITKKVRGLLCHPCNAALGYVKDNINNLYGMINYLENNN